MCAGGGGGGGGQHRVALGLQAGLAEGDDLAHPQHLVPLVRRLAEGGALDLPPIRVQQHKACAAAAALAVSGSDSPNSTCCYCNGGTRSCRRPHSRVPPANRIPPRRLPPPLAPLCAGAQRRTEQAWRRYPSRPHTFVPAARWVYTPPDDRHHKHYQGLQAEAEHSSRPAPQIARGAAGWSGAGHAGARGSGGEGGGGGALKTRPSPRALCHVRFGDFCVTRALTVHRLWYWFSMVMGMKRGGAASRATTPASALHRGPQAGWRSEASPASTSPQRLHDGARSECARRKQASWFASGVVLARRQHIRAEEVERQPSLPLQNVSFHNLCDHSADPSAGRHQPMRAAQVREAHSVTATSAAPAIVPGPCELNPAVEAALRAHLKLGAAWLFPPP